MYKKLYDEDSENPEAALNYARILILTKQYGEALSFIEELKTRFTESTENKAFAELEEKIKKAQEEPEKQEKEAQDKDDNVQKKNDTADSTESRPEKGASDSKNGQDAAKPGETGTVKNEGSQTKPPTNSEKAKVDDGKKT